jgi:hypothetical protein
MPGSARIVPTTCPVAAEPASIAPSIHAQHAGDSGLAHSEHRVEPPAEPKVGSSNLSGRASKASKGLLLVVPMRDAPALRHDKHDDKPSGIRQDSPKTALSFPFVSARQRSLCAPAEARGRGHGQSGIDNPFPAAGTARRLRTCAHPGRRVACEHPQAVGPRSISDWRTVRRTKVLGSIASPSPRI